MLYKSISSIKGRYFNFIKYDKSYQRQLEKLFELSPKFAKAVESYPKMFSELSEHQSYLLLNDSYFLIGAVVLGTSEDEQTLEVNLYFVPDEIKPEYFNEMLSELIQSLENYFYNKKAIEIQFLNSIDESLLQNELGFTKKVYAVNFTTYHRENKFNKTIPLLIEEINYAEQCLLNWKQFWYADYSQRRNSNYQIDEDLLEEYENHSVQYNGRIFYKTDQVLWHSIKSNKSDRTIIFYRNGEIEFNKDSSNDLPTYETTCNVISQDFIITAKQPYINGYDNYRKKPTYANHTYSLTKSDNIYTILMDKIEMVYDIEKGTKTFRIVQPRKKHGEASVTFEVNIDEDGKVKSGYAQISTHKGNGNVNGTYRIGIKLGRITANYYSRKGKKFNLSNNPLLIETVLMLIAPKREKSTLSENITTTFIEEATNTIDMSQQERQVNFDATDFNIKSIISAENGFIDFFKQISGEIPIKCLSERLTKFLEYIEDKKMDKPSSNQKRLLKSNPESIYNITKKD